MSNEKYDYIGMYNLCIQKASCAWKYEVREKKKKMFRIPAVR
jgi:hypothetical protein